MIGHGVTKMLHHAYHIRIACVLVLAVEQSLPKSLVASNNIALVHPDLDVTIQVSRDVWQRRVRLIQKFWQRIIVCHSINCLLDAQVLIACQNIV